MKCRYDNDGTECDEIHHHFCAECKRDMNKPMIVSFMEDYLKK